MPATGMARSGIRAAPLPTGISSRRKRNRRSLPRRRYLARTARRRLTGPRINRRSGARGALAPERRSRPGDCDCATVARLRQPHLCLPRNRHLSVRLHRPTVRSPDSHPVLPRYRGLRLRTAAVMPGRRVASHGDPGRPVVNRVFRKKTTLPAGAPFCSDDSAGPIPGAADMDKEQGMTDEATRYLNTRQAADHLGLSTRTLDRFRVVGRRAGVSEVRRPGALPDRGPGRLGADASAQVHFG